MTIRMVLGLLLLKLSLSSWLLLVVGISKVKPDCNATCGNLIVPYPFGIGPRCAANDELYITCNYTYTPPRPFIAYWNLKIVSILESEVRIRNYLSYTCYYSSGQCNNYSNGCNTSAIIKGANEERYTWNPYLEHGCQGFGLGILLLLTVTFWLYSGLHKRRLAKLKERYFKQNGGLLLQQHQLSLRKSGSVYTAEEHATNNYDERQIVGRGGNGIVYKGVLPPDNKLFLSSWLFLLIASPAANAAVELFGVKNPSCNTKCGNLNVPYPFGIGAECAANDGLYITCDSANDPPTPYVRTGDIVIVNISESEVLIKNNLARVYYNTNGEAIWNVTSSTDLLYSAYTFSDKRNMFFSTGCNTAAFITGHDAKRYTSGCISWCGDKESILDGSCSGMGCCQTPIPKGLTYFGASLRESDPDFVPEQWTMNITSYAFLGDPDEFKFQASDLINDDDFLNKVTEHVPVVLDWVIEERTCEEAKTTPTSYSCKSNNSYCYDFNNGYRCDCADGYNGNPYLENGCQDINECKDSSKHKCISASNCLNSPGGYSCICLPGTDGDGLKDGKRLQSNSKAGSTSC